MAEFGKAGQQAGLFPDAANGYSSEIGCFPNSVRTAAFQHVYIFRGGAAGALILACINFMNLSTARSSNRAREVGIRKVVGSERKYLVTQFLAESILTTTIATCWLALAFAFLPAFNELSGKQLALPDFFQTGVFNVSPDPSPGRRAAG